MIAYFAVTFLITWAAWTGAGTIPPDATGSLAVVRTVLIHVGTLAPGLIAIAMTAFASGRTGVRALLRRLVKSDVAPRWYLFAVGYMFVVKLVAASAHRLLLGSWPPFSEEPIVLLLGATFLSTIVMGQAGEELGWRGFALPRLASRLGYAGAGVIIGAIWALWHLPLFYIGGADKTGQSFPVWGLSVIALSVAITWLYCHTGGSLLLTMLMHAATNNLGQVVSSATPAAHDVWTFRASPMMQLTLLVLWIPALWFLVRMPGGGPTASIQSKRIERSSGAPV